MPEEIAKPANRRTGRSKGYRGQKGGAHQIAWRDDPVILDRMQAGWQSYIRHRSGAECLKVVREFMAKKYPNEPPISMTTMWADRQRSIELRRENVVNALEEHLAEFDEALMVAWADVNSLRPGHARNTALATIITAIEKKAKLDGSMVEKRETRIEGSVELAAMPAPPTASEYGAACAVLYQQSQEFRESFDAALGRVTVDMQPPALGPATDETEDEVRPGVRRFQREV